MRIAFVDEGGISRHEPHVIVAAVFVHADDQVIPLENKLQELVRKHIPEKDWNGFVFHAKDIWSGTKYFRNRDEWPWERRAAILDDLVAIPKELEIPAVHSSLTKSEFRAEIEEQLIAMKGRATAHDAEIAYHAISFTSCMLRVEDMMRRVWPDEIAQIVAEDNSDVRATIKGMSQILKNPARVASAGLGDVNMLPLQKIRGPVFFAEKDESGPLQLADACAFLIRRRYTKHDARSAHFYEKLRKWMLVVPHEDAGQPIRGRFLRSWRTSAA